MPHAMTFLGSFISLSVSILAKETNPSSEGNLGQLIISFPYRESFSLKGPLVDDYPQDLHIDIHSIIYYLLTRLQSIDMMFLQ